MTKQIMAEGRSRRAQSRSNRENVVDHLLRQSAMVLFIWRDQIGERKGHMERLGNQAGAGANLLPALSTEEPIRYQVQLAPANLGDKTRTIGKTNRHRKEAHRYGRPKRYAGNGNTPKRIRPLELVVLGRV
jgi:hypothetical protein